MPRGVSLELPQGRIAALLGGNGAGTKALAENSDVKEFYLGLSTEGRKSFRDMKSYRRRKRWL